MASSPSSVIENSDVPSPDSMHADARAHVNELEEQVLRQLTELAEHVYVQGLDCNLAEMPDTLLQRTTLDAIATACGVWAPIRGDAMKAGS